MGNDSFGDDEVAVLEVRRPELVALGRLASVAAIVEPALLRRLRLEVGGRARARLGPDAPSSAWHAGLEADLWFSRLVHVATPSQMTLRPDVLEVLRAQLRDPAHRDAAEKARGVVLDAHRGHTDMVRLEEDIIWSTIAGDADGVGAALERALVTMTMGPDRAVGVVRWFMQARRRIPRSALHHHVGKRLLAAVSMHLDRVIPAELLAADRFPDAVADLAPDTLPEAEVGVVMAANGIRFTAPDDPHAGPIPIPETRPRVIEATWEDRHGTNRTTLVRVDDGRVTALPGLTGHAVLRTISGRRFSVRAAQVRQIVVAIFGSHTAWRAVDDLDHFLTDKVSDPGIEIRTVRDPADVFIRAEIVVLGERVDRRDRRAFRSFMPGFARAVARSRNDGAAVLATSDVATSQRQELSTILGSAAAVIHMVEVSEESRITDAVIEAIQRLIAAPSRLYELDVDTALTMLNSVALAFHVRGLYAEDVEPDDENWLFDLVGGEESTDYQIFRHVRGLCEWLFAGPVRNYLAGGPDPTTADSHRLHDPGWSPPDRSWVSFSEYLEWFVSRFHRFAVLLRDRLGPKRIVNRYAVPIDSLEAARLAVGTGPLPTTDDEPVSYSSRADDAPKTLYAVERAELPALINALATPVLSAVREESDRRATRLSESAAEPDMIVIAEPRTDGSVELQIMGSAIGSGFVLRPMGFDPREIEYEVARLVQTRRPRGRLSPEAIGELGRYMHDALPESFWSQFLTAVRAVSPRPPRLQITSPVDAPWEVSATDPGPTDDSPAYLGCQAAVALWPTRRLPLGSFGPTAAVYQPAVIAPSYQRSTGVQEEAAVLVDRYNAHRLPSDLDGISKALHGNTAIRLVHVAGRYANTGDDGVGLVLDNSDILTASTLTAQVMSLRQFPVVFVFTGIFMGGAAWWKFVTALVEAGAAGVVAPMWELSDRDSVEFVRRFYRGALEEGLPIAEVLRRLRCERQPLGATAMAYRLIGDVALRLAWQPDARQ